MRGGGRRGGRWDERRGGEGRWDEGRGGGMRGREVG